MGGGNSRMMIENAIATELETNLNNHVNLINNISAEVTQSYVDRVKTNVEVSTTVSQVTKLKNIRITDNAELRILQEGTIQSSLIAQNMIKNETKDRTDLGNIMATALDQAVTAQADMNTSQQAKNVLENMNQNNGGIEGMFAKLADSVVNLFGGGNTEQDIKNTLDATLRQNVNNTLNMENIINTKINKNFESVTETSCKTDLSIEQLIDAENIDLSGNARMEVVQKASIDSAVKCFNEIYNIREISTEVTTESGIDIEQALSALAEQTNKQDTDNKGKNTKLQKNFMDSMGGSCGMIIVAVILVGVVGGKGGGGGSGGGSSGGKKKSKYGMIIGFFVLLFIIGLIYLLIQHRDIFAGTKLEKVFDKLADLNPSGRLLLEAERAGQEVHYKIFDAESNMQLSISDKRASVKDVEDLPNGAKSLEFRDEEDKDFKFRFIKIDEADLPTRPVPTRVEGQDGGEGTDIGPAQDDDEPLKKYKIVTHDNEYQLGLIYTGKTRNESNKAIVEPILYKISQMEGGLNGTLSKQFVFSITPDIGEGEDRLDTSSFGYVITHHQINTDDITNAAENNLEDGMVGQLQISSKPINGGLFRSDEDDDFSIKGVELVFEDN
tara:strand:+ start:7821 stop:9653 length:1833 start_codon:yes stop_codon:yes gene_type:complete